MILGLGLSGGAWWRTIPVLVALAVGDHVRQPRRRPFALALPPVHHRGDGRRRRLGARRGRGRARARVRHLARRDGRPAARAPSRRGACARRPWRDASGRPRAVPAGQEAMAFFRRRAGMTAEEAARASVPFNYGPRCRREHADRIAEDIRRRLAHPFTPSGPTGRSTSPPRCTTAIAGSAGSRCRRSSCTVGRTRSCRWPTGEILAERVPGAELRGPRRRGASLFDRASPRSTRRSRGFFAGRPG